jgi:hypothetical protein
MVSKQRARAGQAALLTALSISMSIGLGLSLGTTAFVLSAIALPLPLAVLWLSADVLRADERREHVSSERRAVLTELRAPFGGVSKPVRLPG